MANKQGYIYILSNKAFRPDLYKIGLTTRKAEDRAYEIYIGSTGVPAEFEVTYTYPVSDCHVAEKQIHENLDAFRFNDEREFFEVGLVHAKSSIKEVCNSINRTHKNAGSPPKIKQNDWVLLNEASSKYDESNVERPERTIIVRQIRNENGSSHDIPVAEVPKSSSEKYTRSQVVANPTQINSENHQEVSDIISERVEPLQNWQPPINWLVLVLVIGIGGIGNIYMAVDMMKGEPHFTGLIFFLMGIGCIIIGLKNLRS
jgi:hypothetical protein